MAWLAREAGKRADPQLLLPGAKTVIALAVAYGEVQPQQTESGVRGPCPVAAGGAGRPGTVDHGLRTTDYSTVRIPHSGFIARYARYADYHEVLAEKLKALADFVDHLGGGGTRSRWYADTGPLLERDLAQRAGLGFVGKHTNLISRAHGNWMLLAEVLTTLEVEPDGPERNRCGRCARCLAACPTQALVAPFQLEARRCLSYLTIELKGAIPVELRPALGRRVFGCDDCLAVCPWNRWAHGGGLMRGFARPDLAAPDLLELLALDEKAFAGRFAGTPLCRGKRRGLLRNVCVALGNVGGEDALPALRQAAADAEPLIAEHAQWAIGRIQQRRRR
jgi:epoxyqueuosine reductase